MTAAACTRYARRRISCCKIATLQQVGQINNTCYRRSEVGDILHSTHGDDNSITTYGSHYHPNFKALQRTGIDIGFHALDYDASTRAGSSSQRRVKLTPKSLLENRG